MTSQVRLAIWIADRGGRIEVAFFLPSLASLGMRQYHRKIARASKAAAGFAGAGEQPGRPTR